VLALAVVGAACWAIGFGSDSVNPAQIPQFETGLNADSHVFVANYLSLMMGNSKTSQFNNIVETWAKFLENDKASMSQSDFLTAQGILVSMREYQDMKVKRNLKDPKAIEFFKNMAKSTTFSAEKMLNTESPKASGKQLAFWIDAQKLLTRFATPHWVNKNLEEIEHHGDITIDSNKSDFRANAFGPQTVKDTEGNQLMTMHAAAVGLLKNSFESFQGPSVGRALEETPNTHFNASRRYLHLFEAARLGNMLTEEDNQFAHLTEEKLADWESSTEHKVSTHSLLKNSHKPAIAPRSHSVKSNKQ